MRLFWILPQATALFHSNAIQDYYRTRSKDANFRIPQPALAPNYTATTMELAKVCSSAIREAQTSAEIVRHLDRWPIAIK